MKHLLHEKRRSNVLFQRNALLGLSASLLSILLIQTTYLFFKSEKTIILPPELKQSFWVEGSKFSPVYLEEQALFFAHLLLDVSESSVLYQGEMLMRNVTPDAHSQIQQQILEEQKRLKKENLATLFQPHDVHVNPKTLTVDITGDLCGYVGGKRVTQSRETYRITFTSKQSRLFLQKFEAIQTDQKGDEHEVQKS